VKLDREEVLGKLLKLREDTTPSPAGIHPMLLKSCSEVVAEPLSIISQTSFESEMVPNDWKTAIVNPVVKKGRPSRFDPVNNRPILLTSVCCKLMESLIRPSRTAYLDNKDVITNK